jgi:hypothetical protein
MGNIIFSMLATLWIAYEIAFDPPSTYGALVTMRIIGTLNALVAIAGCLLTMYGSPKSEE